MHLHEIDVDEERLIRMLRRIIEKIHRVLLDVGVQVGNADHALFRRVHVFRRDLPVLLRRLAGVAGQGALGDLFVQVAEFIRHGGEPFGVAVGVGVEVIKHRVPHHVEALGIGQRVIRLAEVPFPGEVGLVSRRLEHRRDGPFRRRQAAALALEGHGGHAAAGREAPRHHGRPARRAGGLGVEVEKGHPLIGDAVEAGGGHAAPDASAPRPGVAIAEIVRND